jgi:hypothetical protein
MKYFIKITWKTLLLCTFPKSSLSLSLEALKIEVLGFEARSLQKEGSTSPSLVFCPSLILIALLLFLCEGLFHGLVPVSAPDETSTCNLGARRGGL